MALYDKFQFLLARENQASGGLESHALHALYTFLARLVSVRDVPEPSLVTVASVTQTASTIKASSGKLLYVFIKSPAAANDDCVVSFFDNSVLRFAVRCKQTKSVKIPLFTDEAGVEFDTNLTVTALKVDNSTNLDAGDRPALEVLVS